MIYGVLGPRDFNNDEYKNYAHIERVLSSFTDIEKLILGGSRGVERMAQRWASETNKPFQLIRPNTQLQSVPAAFNLRNSEIIQASDAMIIFWDGIPSYTMSALTMAIRAGKEASVIPMV